MAKATLSTGSVSTGSVAPKHRCDANYDMVAVGKTDIRIRLSEFLVTVSALNVFGIDYRGDCSN